MSITRARKVYNSVNFESPFYTRVEYIECLAALVALFPDEASKIIPGPKKPVYKVLWNAAAVDRVEWMFNNIRVRHSIPISECQLLSSGTASNEALHAEINRWFKQTQMMHQSTLRLKLHVLTLAKLLSHNSAMYRPTTRQYPPGVVLARSAGCHIWTNASWIKWCSHLVHRDRVTKADVPIRDEWRQDAIKVKQHILKRPSSHHAAIKRKPNHPLAKLKRKRTAFTRQRRGGLLSQGSKIK